MYPLELKNINKEFKTADKTLSILSDINLKIKENTSVAIVGKSGAGKSTLLHICGTLDKPTSGSLIYNGTDISGLNDKQISVIRNKEIGFIFQSHLLMEDFTVFENVLMPALIKNTNKTQALERAEYLLEKVGLKDRTKHYPGQISGGEKQRVAICRALINNPSVILADEPTGALDEENASQIENLLLEIVNSEKRTLLLVTHNTDFAFKCNFVYNLSNKNLRVLK